MKSSIEPAAFNNSFITVSWSPSRAAARILSRFISRPNRTLASISDSSDCSISKLLRPISAICFMFIPSIFACIAVFIIASGILDIDDTILLGIPASIFIDSFAENIPFPRVDAIILISPTDFPDMAAMLLRLPASSALNPNFSVRSVVSFTICWTWALPLANAPVKSIPPRLSLTVFKLFAISSECIPVTFISFATSTAAWCNSFASFLLTPNSLPSLETSSSNFPNELTKNPTTPISAVIPSAPINIGAMSRSPFIPDPAAFNAPTRPFPLFISFAMFTKVIPTFSRIPFWILSSPNPSLIAPLMSSSNTLSSVPRTFFDSSDAFESAWFWSIRFCKWDLSASSVERRIWYSSIVISIEPSCILRFNAASSTSRESIISCCLDKSNFSYWPCDDSEAAFVISCWTETKLLDTSSWSSRFSKKSWDKEFCFWRSFELSNAVYCWFCIILNVISWDEDHSFDASVNLPCIFSIKIWALALSSFFLPRIFSCSMKVFVSLSCKLTSSSAKSTFSP